MVRITLGVLMTPILPLQPHPKRLSQPKVPQNDPDCSQQNSALDQYICETAEKAAGSFVGQISFLTS